MHGLVEALEQRNGGEIFTPTELVGNPLTGLAGIVEIEHGSDGVHT